MSNFFAFETQNLIWIDDHITEYFCLEWDEFFFTSSVEFKH